MTFFAEDDEESKRRIWAQLRDDILQQHIERHPGTRPAAWWLYDAPEPRRRVGGIGVVEGDNYFGIPSLYSECDCSNPPMFETQDEYLRRHRLLTNEEKHRLEQLSKDDGL